MSAQAMPPHFTLYRIITGFYVSQAIYVMARLGIADFLRSGPLNADDLAQRSKTHAPSLKRVLRLLAAADVFTEDNEGRFALTPIGDHLRAGVPGSMRAAALLFGGITQRAWGDLLHSVKTGEPAFRRVFGHSIAGWILWCLFEHEDIFEPPVDVVAVFIGAFAFDIWRNTGPRE